MDDVTSFEPTLGDYRVQTGFNPSGLHEVDQIKAVTASLINNINPYSYDENPEIRRWARIAQSKYEEACMFAVKAAVIASKGVKNAS